MLTEQQRRELDWEKTDGLMPVIVQHAVSGEVLMLGYMNPEALDKTIESGKVTFFSRTKQRLWTKGETSGNFLNVVNIAPDCDNDTLLVLAIPSGQPATKAPAAASATPLTSGCSCINWNNCSPNANLPIRKPLTQPNCMPAAPNALHRKWAKRAWKPH
ncbi:histidine biosynthesis bifunctional protein [includes phosphoribosyl-AMP cyclohydrolase;phosphoribosyl-ATP pyrophosphatase] [Escherichia coli]|nr:histidine biosynthesis bifunctional protein [includes phosphoribosyl-AMP cyclohydrolase;phosphoribosyl-ATP pyrophosphatase] [Escherichia coli]